MFDKLQRMVVAAHRGDLSGAVDMSAEMVEYARSEISRLRTPHSETMRVLAEHDYESKIRCLALERLLRVVDSAEKSG